MTGTEKGFAFGLPIIALVISLVAIFHPVRFDRGGRGNAASSSPPVVVDVKTNGANSCTASPQHPYVYLQDNNQIYFNAADSDRNYPIYWVEFNTSVCRANPSDSGDNYKAPQNPNSNGYSRLYTPPAVNDQDVPYIICPDVSGGTPPNKCSGPGYFGVHIKPAP